jgi:hypothetical protein
MKESGKETFILPASADHIYGFCYWAAREKGKSKSQDIVVKTLEKYLYGIKAWHLFHKAKYPEDVDPRVKVLLRLLAQVNALKPPREKKGELQLRHLVFLDKHLLPKGPKEKAIFDLAEIAFWGMARLGELTSTTLRGELERQTSVLASDVAWERVRETMFAVLLVQEAKTSKPGGTQLICLRPMENMLCPVEAIRRRLLDKPKDNKALFGYNGERRERVHLTKYLVMRTLDKAWERGQFTKITGHSF